MKEPGNTSNAHFLSAPYGMQVVVVYAPDSAKEYRGDLSFQRRPVLAMMLRMASRDEWKIDLDNNDPHGLFITAGGRAVFEHSNRVITALEHPDGRCEIPGAQIFPGLNELIAYCKRTWELPRWGSFIDHLKEAVENRQR